MECYRSALQPKGIGTLVRVEVHELRGSAAAWQICEYSKTSQPMAAHESGLLALQPAPADGVTAVHFAPDDGSLLVSSSDSFRRDAPPPPARR